MVMAFLGGQPADMSSAARVHTRPSADRDDEKATMTYLASSLVAKTTSANPVGEGRAGKWSVVETTVPEVDRPENGTRVEERGQLLCEQSPWTSTTAD